MMDVIKDSSRKAKFKKAPPKGNPKPLGGFIRSSSGNPTFSS
jgi:hypothetical protein